ncbi:MAG: MATE family efflux transporter [Lachnospiraceae bacterium]|nr:MATE family efflux transporter [Lachnospiraceae bacterium]MBP5565089.1 MATE family efflux transporter [Lachnospiraceae bacterium]
MKSKNEMDMCSGSIFVKMLLFAVPLMLSSMLQLLFNAADIIVVGNYAGDNSLAAVGATGSLINLLTNLFIGLSVGVNVLVARYYGSKDFESLRTTIQTSVTLSAILGLFVMVVGVLLTPTILRWMQLQGEILKLASLYLQIYFLGMPAVMIYNFGSAILRSVGDTRRPLIYMLLSGFVNVGLNLLFVIVFHMGVAGVAIATIVSQAISAFLIVLTLCLDKSEIHFDIRKLELNKSILLKILRIGLPAGFQSTLFSLSNVFIQSSVNLFGDTVIAGNSSAINIEGFVYVAMNSFHQAAISFVSQNMGAGRRKRVNRITVIALLLVSSTGLLLGTLCNYFSHELLGIYSKNPDIIAAGSIRVSIICTIYFLCGIMDVMVGSLRGLGYSTMPAIVSLIGACVFRLIWLATLFQIDSFHNIQTIYYSYPISWILTFSVHVICYLIVARKKKLF